MAHGDVEVNELSQNRFGDRCSPRGRSERSRGGGDFQRGQVGEREPVRPRNDISRYDELASTLDLNPSSVGTLLARAQQAFRKEYIKRYGEA